MEGILYSELEFRIIIFIRQFMSDFAVKLAGFITEFGDEMAAVVIVGLIYWCLNKKLGKRLAVNL